MTVSTQTQKTRYDDWLSLATGVGGRQSRTDFSFAPVRVDDQTLENMFYGDAYAARISRVVPAEALRQGFRFACEDPAIAGRVTKRLDALHARQRLGEAWTWARVLGGAAILVGADDGQNDPALPLDADAIRTIHFLAVVDKRELQALDYYADPLSPNFGEPEVYQLQQQAGTEQRIARVHASRLIRFDGAMTSRRMRARNNGWSESELQRVYTALQAFNGAYAATGTLLQDASQGVFKIQDFIALLASDTQDAFKQRLEMMDYARSAARAIVLDSTESFERVETTLTGLPDTLEKFILLLAGAAEIPVTVLMGQAPAGLSATGDADIRWFYDRIRSEQQSYLRPRLERLIRLVLRAKDGPTGGVEPEGWTIEFPDLMRLDPLQEAQRRAAVATTDVAYITAGVVSADEVAVNRFRRDGWSPETSIDLDVRRDLMSADLDASSAEPAAGATTQLNAAAPAPPTPPARPQSMIAPAGAPIVAQPQRGLTRPAMGARMNAAGALADLVAGFDEPAARPTMPAPPNDDEPKETT